MADLMTLLKKMIGKGYSSLTPPVDNRPQWEQDLERLRASGVAKPRGSYPETSNTTMLPKLWDNLGVEDRKRILSYMGGTGPLSDEQVTYALQNMGGMYPRDQLYESSVIEAKRGR